VDTSREKTLYFRNVDGPWLTKLNAPRYQQFVPAPLRHRGVLWWRSQVYVFVCVCRCICIWVYNTGTQTGWCGGQLMRYIFRPKPFVEEYIQHRRHALAWSAALAHEQGLVALHVRHGDKSWDVVHQSSYIGPLSPYLSKASYLCQRARGGGGLQGGHGAGEWGGFGEEQRIFISTDDISVLDEARRLRLNALWDEEEARYNGTHVYAVAGVSEKLWPGFPGNDPLVCINMSIACLYV
jgi:hypothetical protein